MTGQVQTSKNRNLIIKLVLLSAGILMSVDIVYKISNNISYMQRQKCILYQSLPRIGFLLYEYVIELTLSVLLGIFFASLAEKYFFRFGKWYPRNPVFAFLYGSLIPVCACSAIPLVQTLKGKMKLATIVTFIIAAPLLNPYIIFLSFNVLGPAYALLRIATSFVLALSTGYTVSFLYKRKLSDRYVVKACPPSKCPIANRNVFEKTKTIFISILPYLAIAGAIGIVLELFNSEIIDSLMKIGSTFPGRSVLILTGIPFYFCNGADVLLLRPFLHSGLTLGTAISFSLTSTSICITSIFMLAKFLSKRIALYCVVYIFFLSLALSFIIDLCANAAFP